MALLKKIRGSTLMETLVATVLIVLIFMMASMVLNTIITRNIANNTSTINAHLNRLEYEYIHHVLRLPHKEDRNGWEVTFVVEANKNTQLTRLEAKNLKTEKIIVRYGKSSVQ